MAGVNTEGALNKLTSDNLHRHRIIIVPERRIAPLAVYLLNISNNAMMAEYRVRIGKFRVYVKVINFHVEAILTGYIEGEGAFGTIIEKSVAKQEFLAKVQKKIITKEQIEDVVREVAISKLCSMLQIGPAIETNIPFDVAVYTNAVQFHLERCKPLSNKILQKYG
jgi:hypothetical protein